MLRVIIQFQQNGNANEKMINESSLSTSVHTHTHTQLGERKMPQIQQLR